MWWESALESIPTPALATLFYTAADVCNNQNQHKAGGYHIFKMRGIDLCDLMHRLQEPAAAAAAAGSCVECPIEID